MRDKACAGWAVDGNVTGPGSSYTACKLFAAVVRRVPRPGSYSGGRNVCSTSVVPAHTGGLNGGKRNWWSPAESPCRHLAHALGSPLNAKEIPQPLPAVVTMAGPTEAGGVVFPCEGSWRRVASKWQAARDVPWTWECLHPGTSNETDAQMQPAPNGTVPIETIYFWGDSVMLWLQKAALAQLGGRAISGDNLGKAKHPRDGRILVRWLNVWGSQRDWWHTYGKQFEGGGEPSALVGNFGLLHEMLNRKLNETDAHFAGFEEKFEVNRSPNLRQLVFLTPPALHKFRQPFCTQARARSFGLAIGRRLRRKWSTFDLERITRGRADGAKDGMHYEKEVAAVAVCELFRHLGISC